MYSITLKLKNKDVDLHRRLRTSRMMELFQEASIAHTEQLGAGREKTLDRGLLWTVFQQRADIVRMPEYDEEITVESWPGKMQHVLFPRYYRIRDNQGNVLVQASAMWLLIDMQSRRMVFPSQYGIRIDGEEDGTESPLPRIVRQEKTEAYTSFRVPYSYCDLNGHMNNTRYYDLAEDQMPLAAHERVPREIHCEFIAEIRCEQEVRIGASGTDSEWSFVIEGEKTCFRMKYLYE